MTSPGAICAVLAITAAVGVGVPAAAAGASATPATTEGLPIAGLPVLGGPAGAGGGQLSGACGTSTGPSGQGGTAGTIAEVCASSGLTFVEPAVGQVASVIGPTVIGPAVVVSVTSAGNGAVG
jgi:hypothetical protein